MNNLKSKKWWNASLTRMIKTMAQTCIAMIGTSTMISDINWLVVLSSTLLAGLLSLLSSLGGLPEVEDDDEE